MRQKIVGVENRWVKKILPWRVKVVSHSHTPRHQ
jgi:hypothetical protein